MSDEQDWLSRLSHIETRWTLLRQGQQQGTQAEQAQAELLGCYRQAVFRYLVGLTRDGDLAEDLFQEFVVRFLSGKYRHADPQRGQFRSYLKTSLVHMVKDHFRKVGRGPREQPLEEGEHGDRLPGDDELSADFDEAWREELLRRAWDELEAHESAGQPYYRVLRLRATHRDANSQRIAELLNESLQTDSPYNAAAARKILQRARERFALLLLGSVSQAIGSDDKDKLEDELIALGLHAYCRHTLQRKSS